MKIVRDLMTEDPVCVEPHATMDQVHDRMLALGIRHMPVVVDDEIVGIISNRDIISLLGRLGRETFDEQAKVLARFRADQAMSRGVETIEPDIEIETAAQLMLDNKIGCLPVCEGAHLVGILTEADFVRYVAKL